MSRFGKKGPASMRGAARAISLAACTALVAIVPLHAQAGERLVGLINNYRVAPGTCDGRPAKRAEPLAPSAALARVRIAPASFLEQSLRNAGYAAEHAEAIHVAGLADTNEVMAVIRQSHCRTLLNPRFTDVGVVRRGDEWQIVLAEPAKLSRRPPLPDLKNAETAILAAVNAARATPRRCGDKEFPAAPALAWNALLAEAAHAHSRDMATQRYFDHVEKNGSVPGDRATKAGYRWHRIAENIAEGQASADEVVAAWLSSPGHCANLMSAEFTEMGAAFAINDDVGSGPIYWTQVFGTPRQPPAQ